MSLDMTYKIMNLITNSIQDSLEERKEEGDIFSYDIQSIPDDHKIEVYIMKPASVEAIEVTYSLKTGATFLRN